MQWNCPHCGTSLALRDDSFTGGWSFAKCFQCAGHALIRRTEINVIKVDKAPPGEKVLLPERSADMSIGALSEPAVKEYVKHLQKKEEVLELPPPLPIYQKKESSKITRLITFGISCTIILTLFSGGALFLESDDILHESPKPKKEPGTLLAQKPEVISDHIHQAMMAPIPEPPKTSSAFQVKIMSKTASFHAGPGLAYPIVGKPDLDKVYSVTDWSDRWLRVTINDSPQPKFGWIPSNSARSQGPH